MLVATVYTSGTTSFPISLAMFKGYMSFECALLLGPVGAVWTSKLRLFAALIALMPPLIALVPVHLAAELTRELTSDFCQLKKVLYELP